MAVRRFSEHRSEPLEQQPENGLALASGPAELLGVVVEDGPEALVGAMVTRPHDADRLRRLVDHEVVGGRQRELFGERVRRHAA